MHLKPFEKYQRRDKARSRCNKNDHGFTLIEVLVALSIFSIAGVALINAQSENIRTASYLEEKAFAEIMAENILIETMTSPKALNPGFVTGEGEIAFHQYRWRRQILETNTPGLQRIEVTILREDGEQALTSLSALRKAN